MIYALDTHYEHITDENPYDTELIEFPGCENVRLKYPQIDEYARGAPAVIEFVGSLESASRFDHLINWPSHYLLISKRMVQVLESVRLFRYQIFPARIYSRKIGHLVMSEYRERTWYQVSDPALYTDNFVILKMSEDLDCLDHERTIVRGVSLSQSGEKFLAEDDAEHFAFREPEGGFPPVFHPPELLFYCYSEEAKQACERAGLKGLVFQPLP